MEWTLDQFYSDGGTTKFVDRLAATLGIHAGSIKVVGVYEGSLIALYNIIIEEIDGELEEEPLIDVDEEEPDGDESTDDDTIDDTDKEEGEDGDTIITKPVKKPLTQKEKLQKLRTLKALQTELFVTAKIDLGAPVLDAANGEEPVVSDGIVAAEGYKPVVITETETNADWKEGDAIPQPTFKKRSKYVMPAIGVAGIVIVALCFFGVSGKFGHKKVKEVKERRASIRRSSSSVAAKNESKQKQIDMSDIVDIETERNLQKNEKVDFDALDMVGHGAVPNLT